MTDPLTLTISVLALVVSAATAWLTLFRRGRVKMTQPTVIYFGHDKLPPGEDIDPPKVYLRTLLFATSKRGRVIESMHISLTRNETLQNFNIWVHGDESLVRGSGLFVGETGVSANHHFMTPKDARSFMFSAGWYRLNVYARILGDRKQTLLFSHDLEITKDLAKALLVPGNGLYFDWGPDSARYSPHVQMRRDLHEPMRFMSPSGIVTKA
jgi:hypothetical protein